MLNRFNIVFLFTRHYIQAIPIFYTQPHITQDRKIAMTMLWLCFNKTSRLTPFKETNPMTIKERCNLHLSSLWCNLYYVSLCYCRNNYQNIHSRWKHGWIICYWYTVMLEFDTIGGIERWRGMKEKTRFLHVICITLTDGKAVCLL